MTEFSKALPSLVDSQLSIEKIRVALQTRQSHLKKKKRKDLETDELLSRLIDIEEYVDSRVAKLLKDHPAYPWFSRVLGIGPENIAKVVGLIDIEKAPTVSSLWKFCGFHVTVDNKAPKRIPGEKLEYNSKLRSMCWRLGNSLIRARSKGEPGKFGKYYYQEKEKYVLRFLSEGKTIVPAEKLPRVKGKKVETDEFISEGHVHNMAARKMIKMFLSMLWLVWREAEGLPTNQPYVISHLKHTHIRTPDEWLDKPLKKKRKLKCE